MTHQYQILYDNLITKIQVMDNIFLESLCEDKIPLLDDNGYDIMYQLYDMFMKKNNLPIKKFIIQEEEYNEYNSITLDFKNMPLHLKALLYTFAQTHFNSLLQ
jgi:hypothetical protein